MVEAHSRPRLTGNITEDMASGATDFVLRDWSDERDGSEVRVESTAAMAGGRKKGLAHGVKGLIHDLGELGEKSNVVDPDRARRTNAMAFGTMPSLGTRSRGSGGTSARRRSRRRCTAPTKGERRRTRCWPT